MKCPVCNSHLTLIWEHTGPDRQSPRWFSGAYSCGRCGVIKLDGRVHHDGDRVVLSIIPDCPSHGTIPVVRVRDGVWRCVKCGCEIERDGGQLLRSVGMDLPLRAIAVM